MVILLPTKTVQAEANYQDNPSTTFKEVKCSSLTKHEIGFGEKQEVSTAIQIQKKQEMSTETISI